MNRLAIFGTSGFAREVGDIAVAAGLNPLLIAKDQLEVSSWSFDYEIVAESEIQKYRDLQFVIGIGENQIRKKIASRFANELRFTNLIHPTASFGKGQEYAIRKQAGNIVCAGTRLTNSIRVGNFCIFNLNCTIGHDCYIEDYVNIAPGANVSGNVHLGEGCWIGTGAAINQGSMEAKMKIGEGTVVGSGAVVTKPCDGRSVYVGSPARKLG